MTLKLGITFIIFINYNDDTMSLYIQTYTEVEKKPN